MTDHPDVQIVPIICSCITRDVAVPMAAEHPAVPIPVILRCSGCARNGGATYVLDTSTNNVVEFIESADPRPEVVFTKRWPVA